MSTYPVQTLWAYLGACHVTRVVVDLGSQEVHGHPDQFPTVVEYDGPYLSLAQQSRIAAKVWDCAEADERDGLLRLDGPVEVRVAPVGTRPQRVGEAWRGAS